MSRVIGLCCLLAGTSLAAAAELVKSCKLGLDASARIEVLRDTKVHDSHIYYLRKPDQKKQPLLGDPDSSRGASVHIQCVGRKSPALVLSGEFTANALQGVVLTYDATAGRVERIDFAEKSRPSWLYRSGKETMAVIPTNGYGETDKPYIAYRYMTGSGQAPWVEPMAHLPATGGFEVSRLK